MLLLQRLLLAILILGLSVDGPGILGISERWQSSARAFETNGRWTFTSAGGSTGMAGSPATLSWSIVPDDTFIPGDGPSDLVSFLDSTFGAGDGGADLQTRPWFNDLIKPTFDRWTEVSGLTFVYEENDDGATLGNFSGQVSIRGDVRLGGAFIDGPNGTSAKAGFIPSADITFDTGESNFADPTDNFRNFRNTLMHELGHSLGLDHLDSTAQFLMEPVYGGSIDGMQIDDIRGVQQLYGDAFERDESGAKPNNSITTASDLGTLVVGGTLELGTDAGATTVVTAEQADYVSIANLSDQDFFSFHVDAPGELDVVVTPTGPNYFEKPSGSGSFSLTRSSQVSDLAFELYGPITEGGAPLVAASADAVIGLPESLLDVPLLESGTYAVHVFGTTNVVQLYQLSLSLAELETDYDEDGDSDGGDFLAWQQGFGQTFDAGDLAAWQAHYGASSQQNPLIIVPEPAASVLLAITFVVRGISRKRKLSFATGIKC